MDLYAERPCASPVVACTWERTVGAAPGHRVVPDACVDLIWSGGRLAVAGPDTRPRVVVGPPGFRVVGARLRPGAAGAALGVPASTLCDAVADAADVLGVDDAERLLEELATGPDPHATLRRALELRDAPQPIVRAAVAALGRPRARVGAVADELGLSSRQLQRLATAAVGYGPKVLARVLRLRRLQALAREPAPAPGRSRASLAELALDAGYADQAHMTAEVSRLTGVSPVRFLKDTPPSPT